MLQHSGDLCPGTSPANASSIYSAFLAAGKSITADMLSGGFEEPDADICGAQSFHGFYGIETWATQTIIDWGNSALSLYATGHSQPLASAYHHSITIADIAGSSSSFSLAGSASDPDSGAISFKTRLQAPPLVELYR